MLLIHVCALLVCSLCSGCTGEKVVFVGDSAGGNLVISIAMKLKQLGLRLPDQIVSFYPTAVMRSSVTPSRFLSFADPLLPVGVLYSCLQVKEKGPGTRTCTCTCTGTVGFIQRKV